MIAVLHHTSRRLVVNFNYPSHRANFSHSGKNMDFFAAYGINGVAGHHHTINFWRQNLEIQDSDVLDVFTEEDGILLVMDGKHLQNFQTENKKEPIQVTYHRTQMMVEEVIIGSRGRIGIKLKV
jgi:hypothetical protein